MRYLFPLLFAFSVWAQPDPIWKKLIAVPGPSSAVQVPSNILTGMLFWWVSTDVPNNVTVSNQWLDRISSRHSWQMDLTKSPTNSSLGVRFNGSPRTLTNVSFAVTLGIQGTLWLIFRPDTQAGDRLVLSDSTSGHGIGVNNTPSLRYFGTISGAGTICPVASQTTMDVIVVLTSTNTTWYTNGIAAKTNTTSSLDTFEFAWMGSAGGTLFYLGDVVEWGGWTNAFPSGSQISSLHHYGTNTYGYSP